MNKQATTPLKKRNPSHIDDNGSEVREGLASEVGGERQRRGIKRLLDNRIFTKHGASTQVYNQNIDVEDEENGQTTVDILVGFGTLLELVSRESQVADIPGTLLARDHLYAYKILTDHQQQSQQQG